MFSSLFQKLKRDTEYRTKLFLLLSLLFNVLYALFLFIVSRVYFSKWFFVMSLYYGLLSIARIFMFFQTRSQKPLHKKIRLLRSLGYFLFLLNLVVSVMMFILIYTAAPIKHHEITVITLATYTFSTLTFSIISTIKFWKKNDYSHTCVKLVNLISASVSMVTLTNTMLATFGENTQRLRGIILPLLSCAVSLVILTSAILLIKKANSNLRILKNEEPRK